MIQLDIVPIKYITYDVYSLQQATFRSSYKGRMDSSVPYNDLFRKYSRIAYAYHEKKVVGITRLVNMYAIGDDHES